MTREVVHAPAKADSAQATASIERVIKRQGRALDTDAREYFERSYGLDFRGVRVHDDREAADSARAVNAHAYTVGRHVVSDGPLTPWVLAHELAHTVQQRGVDPSSGPLTLGPASSGLERDADAAATRAARGQAVAPTSFQRASAPVVQRVERGTYVSTEGMKPFLEAGEKFYRSWGHPNVKRVNDMKDVVTDLDRKPGHIDSFRLVAHGGSGNFEFRLLPGYDGTRFTSKEAKMRTSQPFRDRVQDVEILGEQARAERYAALVNDPKASAALAELGAGATLPAKNSVMGVLLRAILDQEFVDDAVLDTGKKPTGKRLPILREFNALRRSLYTKELVAEAPPPKRKAVATAIAMLAKQVSRVVADANILNNTTEDEIDGLAGGIADPNNPTKLNPDIKGSVTEGAEGPYVRALKSLRTKIDEKTEIEIRGCNVGRDPAFLEDMRNLFGEPNHLPKISAPDLYQFFFQLGFETYTSAPRARAKLDQRWQDPDVGLARGYDELSRARGKEMFRVTNEYDLAAFAKRYGYDEQLLRALNPELTTAKGKWHMANTLPIGQPGTPIWLVARSFPAGTNQTMEDFARNVLGDVSLAPLLRKNNPDLKRNIWDKASDPHGLELKPNDVVWVAPKEYQAPNPDKTFWGRANPTIPMPARNQVASPTRTEADLQTEIAGGKGVAFFDRKTLGPSVVLDDKKSAQGLGRWLAAQGWDPAKHSAAQLAKPFERSFLKQARGTYVEFLTPEYPANNINDVLFPDDPRYASHIIRRP